MLSIEVMTSLYSLQVGLDPDQPSGVHCLVASPTRVKPSSHVKVADEFMMVGNGTMLAAPLSTVSSISPQGKATERFDPRDGGRAEGRGGREFE
jgi:hypothetical protein